MCGSDDDHKLSGARIIFTDTEKSNWTWDRWPRPISGTASSRTSPTSISTTRTFCARCWMPCASGWIKAWTDWRLDAIPYLVERDGTNCENLPETHAIIRQIRAALDERYANRMILAEANQLPVERAPVLRRGRRVPHGLPLSPHAPAVHGPAPRRSPAHPRHHGRHAGNSAQLSVGPIFAQSRRADPGNGQRPRARLYVPGLQCRSAHARECGHSPPPGPLLDNNRRRIELLKSILLSFPARPSCTTATRSAWATTSTWATAMACAPHAMERDRNAGFSRALPARLYSRCCSIRCTATNPST